MLAIIEKKTNSIDLYRPIRNYIAFNYSEQEAQNLDDDLETLKQLRAEVEQSSDSPPARRDLLIRYFKALCSMETRFPISPDKDHITTIQFTWFDAFKQKNKSVQVNLHLEKAAVMFNLGAVYSQIGLSDDRSTGEGRTQAVHNFSGAAGAFAYLRDRLAVKAAAGGSATVDVSVECAGMLERLMLAQAQECMFENTIAKGSTPGLCSKISSQVGIYYEEAYAALVVAPLSGHFDNTWVTHVQLKAALFYSEACFRYSLELHEKEEIAEEISRLKTGISVLADTKKSARGASSQLIDAATKLEGYLNKNLERAMKENDRVYLQRVPSSSSLTTLPAVSLVKPMSMDDVLDASKEKLFASLVPDNSAKALSRYTEMVDDVIRTQAEKLQQGSELAQVRLKEMDLPDAIISLEGNASLPEELKDDVEAVRISGGPAGLEAEIQQLRDLRRGNQELLVQTEEMLQKETQEDGQFRSQFGTRWTRPQSSTLTKNLLDRPNRFAANLKQAADSGGKIERSVKEHSALMSILDCRPIEAALPTLAKPMMSLDANEDAIVGASKQSLGHGTLCVSLINRRGLFFAADGRSVYPDPVTGKEVISSDNVQKIHLIGGMLIATAGFLYIAKYVLKQLKPQIEGGITCKECAQAAFQLLKNDARSLLEKKGLDVPKDENDYGCAFLIGAYENNRFRLFVVDDTVLEIGDADFKDDSILQYGFWYIGEGDETVLDIAYDPDNEFVLVEEPELPLSETEDLIRFLLMCMKKTTAREESVGGNIKVYHMPPGKEAQLVFEGGVEKIQYTLIMLKARLTMRQAKERQQLKGKDKANEV